MPRPSTLSDKRRTLIPVVARTFARRGYRRTTTAELARQCKVQENILYRLWPDKKAMFIASIGYVFDLSARTWEDLTRTTAAPDAARALLAYESRHLGEFGHSRIIFAGLSETDDPDIRRALSRMYKRYQAFVIERIRAHRAAPTRARPSRRHPAPPSPTLSAWGLVGLGTVASIARELRLMSDRDRRRLIHDVGMLLLAGTAA